MQVCSLHFSRIHLHKTVFSFLRLFKDISFPTIPIVVQFFLLPAAFSVLASPLRAVYCLYVPLPKVTVKEALMLRQFRFVNRFTAGFWLGQKHMPMLWVHKLLVFQLPTALK